MKNMKKFLSYKFKLIHLRNMQALFVVVKRVNIFFLVRLLWVEQLTKSDLFSTSVNIAERLIFFLKKFLFVNCIFFCHWFISARFKASFCVAIKKNVDEMKKIFDKCWNFHAKINKLFDFVFEIFCLSFAKITLQIHDN